MITSVELQKAIFQSLSTDYSVFEVVPVANSFPYITVGEFTTNENFTKTDIDRFTYYVVLHGWSIGTSSLKAKVIEDYIYKKMKALRVNGFNVEIVNLTMSQILKEQQTDRNTIFHSVQEFEIVINNK